MIMRLIQDVGAFLLTELESRCGCRPVPVHASQSTMVQAASRTIRKRISNVRRSLCCCMLAAARLSTPYYGMKGVSRRRVTPSKCDVVKSQRDVHAIWLSGDIAGEHRVAGIDKLGHRTLH